MRVLGWVLAVLGILVLVSAVVGLRDPLYRDETEALLQGAIGVSLALSGAVLLSIYPRNR